MASEPGVDFCLFCYKAVSEENSVFNVNGEPNNGLLDKFLKVLERHLELEEGFPGRQDVKGSFRKISRLRETLGARTGSCEDCCKIQTSFCDVYHQAKCLELLVKWKLSQLMTVMEFADKVTSRVKLVRDNLITTSSGEGGMELVADLKVARTGLMKICSQSHKGYPKVFLEREEVESSCLSPLPPPLFSGLVDHRMPNDERSRQCDKVTSILPFSLMSSTQNSDLSKQESECSLDLNLTREDMKTKGEIDEVPESEESNNWDEKLTSSEVVEVEAVTDYAAQEDLDVVEEITVLVQKKFQCQDERPTVLEMASLEESRPRRISEAFNPPEETSTTVPVNIYFDILGQGQEEGDGKVDSQLIVDLENHITEEGVHPENAEAVVICKGDIESGTVADEESQTDPSIIPSRRLRTIHRCQICNKTFSSVHNLEAHCETHEEAECDSDDASVDVELSVESGHCSSGTTTSSDPSSEDNESDSQDDGDIGTSLSFCGSDEKRASFKRGTKRIRVHIPECKTEVEQLSDGDGEDNISSNSTNDEASYSLALKQRKVGNRRNNRGTRKTATGEHKIKINSKPKWKFELYCSKLDETTLKLKLTPDGLTLADFYKSDKTEYIKYICTVGGCKERFLHARDLEIHSKLHGEFLCNFCNHVTGFAPTLALHEAYHHTKGSETAMGVPKAKGQQAKGETQKSKDRTPILLQGGTPTFDLLYRCARCVFSSVCKHTLIGHHLSTHLGLLWSQSSCPICHKSFVSNLLTKHGRQTFFRHFAHYHDTRDLNEETIKYCDQCSAFFLRTSQFVVHKRKIHNTTVPVTCPECGQTLPPGVDLPGHKAKHHYPPNKRFPFQCPAQNCYKRFETKFDVEVHVEKVHSSGSGVVESKESEYVSELEKELGPSCVDCGKRFDDVDELTLHQTYHDNNSSVLFGNGVPKYQCQSCLKGFRLLFFLKEHERMEHQHQIDDVSSNNSGEEDKIARSQTNELANIVLTEDGLTLEQVSSNRIERARYRCFVSGCERGFMLQEEFDIHSKWHGKFTCFKCDKVESYAPDLALHEADHFAKELEPGGVGIRKVATFNCIQCPFSTETKHHFLGHHLEDHLKLLYVSIICPVCQFRMKTSNRRSMLIHYKSAHDVSGLSPSSISRCNKCAAYFNNERDCNRHKRVIHCERISCEDCGKVFSKLMYLRLHRLGKHRKDPSAFRFVCTTTDCGKRFETASELDGHTRVLHGEKGGVHTCPQCGKKFHARSGFQRHVRSHTRTTEEVKKEAKKYICEICGRVSGDISKSRLHALTHSGPESWPFSCEVCSKKCVSKESLKMHMGTHSKAVPFVCQVCGQGYRHRHNLRIHVNNKHSDVMQDVARKRRKWR